MPELNLEIEVKIKHISLDGTIQEHVVNTMSIDGTIQWLGQMERMMLREVAEEETATELAKDDF